MPALDLNFDGNPTVPGWYAVEQCYDPFEGAAPHAFYWDGSCWRSEHGVETKGIAFIPIVFESKEDALELAETCDLGW
jgi:hypothetical protein